MFYPNINYCHILYPADGMYHPRQEAGNWCTQRTSREFRVKNELRRWRSRIILVGLSCFANEMIFSKLDIAASLPIEVMLQVQIGRPITMRLNLPERENASHEPSLLGVSSNVSQIFDDAMLLHMGGAG